VPVRNKLAAKAGTLLDERVAPGSIAARRRGLDAPHVRELEGWARELEARTGESIPSFDPRSGGERARVLVLREEPRCLASEGSGFVSIDNNDLAAQHASLAHAAGGLAYEDAVHWNIVPWWIRNPAFGGSAAPRALMSQARRVREDVIGLLDLLGRLEVVVLLGKESQRAWPVIGATGYELIAAPHPSPLAWHQTSVSGVRNSALTINAFARAAALVGSEVSGSGSSRRGT
jgi:hypothetical protein